MLMFKFQEESTLIVEAAIKEGSIEPNSTLYLPLTIKTSVLGMQEYSLRYAYCFLMYIYYNPRISTGMSIGHIVTAKRNLLLNLLITPMGTFLTLNQIHRLIVMLTEPPNWIN